MSRFKLKPLAFAMAAAALPAGFTYAQDNAGEAVEEELIVTGFRRALQNSIAVKQEESSIVEAVSAEDIGKLPDTSIAESLARLPGLAGERRDGRTSGISVRGFSENYVGTTMNGRELLGIGDNRGVEFDLYPSEIISQAVVYKSTEASLMTQGLGGTVDLRTIRPLDSDPIISINGSYEMNDLESANPDFDDTGHRLAFTYSDQFADDTIGLAVSIATMESPSQEEQFRAWGYADSGVYPGAKVLGGHDSFVRSAMMERDTIAGILQFEPNDKVSLTIDALYIDFLDSKVFRGLEEGGPEWGGANYTGTVTDGLVTSGQWDGFRTVIRNDGEEKEAELTTFGANLKYQVSDSWELVFDLAVGESEKNVINIESYSGVGRAGSATQGAPAARSWVMTDQGAFYSDHPSISTPDYTDPNLIRLAGPQAWGGGVAFAFDGRTDGQDGFVNNPSFDEELTTFRAQANGEIEFAIFNGLEFGVNYSDRQKSKINFGAYLTSPTYFVNDTNPTVGADGIVDAADIDGGDGPIPNILGTTDLSVFGLGSILAYDGVGLYRSGYYHSTDAGLGQTDRLGDTYEITEEVLTAYVQADIEAELGSIPLTGNLGLQVISTDQEGSGFDVLNGDGGVVLATPVTDGDSYTDVLPSLTLNFEMTDELTVRFAAAKTLSRARMDDMKPNNVIGFNFDNARRSQNDAQFSAWNGSNGNAQLQPIEANQYDLSVEYYFADDGFVGAAAFYKDLQNWHFDNNVLTDFTQYIVPGYHDADTDGSLAALGGFNSRLGITTSKGEAGGGRVGGYEFQASVPFHLISEALDGAGILFSATFLDGYLEIEDVKSEVPGLSEESYQFTAYYERAGFEFRVSGRKRNEFLTEFPGLSLALTPTTDLGAELWDAQIGYNFSESGIDALDGLSVTLQAQNLTDEETVSAAEDDSRQINKWQHFGSNYLLGFSYKF